MTLAAVHVPVGDAVGTHSRESLISPCKCNVMEFFIGSLSHIVAFNACPTRPGSLVNVCAPPPPSFDFRFLESRGNARERYPVACQRCGSERVKADGLIVLSVLHGSVPAYRLLPPSLRRERGAGACVCVAVCHSGRTHSIEKQPALLKTCCCCPLAVVCGYFNQKKD